MIKLYDQFENEIKGPLKKFCTIAYQTGNSPERPKGWYYKIEESDLLMGPYEDHALAQLAYEKHRDNRSRKIYNTKRKPAKPIQQKPKEKKKPDTRTPRQRHEDTVKTIKAIKEIQEIFKKD